MHRYSHKRRLALELRLSLISLFTLCALAVTTHVSIMLAGFALGLVISAVGEPRRLARQLFGITEGFFGPLFFVWLGASLQVRELGQHPWLILLGVGLGVGAMLAHCVGRLFGQPLTLAVLSAAQLGVPVAAATLGTEQHLLARGRTFGVDARRTDNRGDHIDRRSAGGPSSERRGIQSTFRIGGIGAVGVRADAVGPFECAAQRERGAVADLPGHRGDGGPGSTATGRRPAPAANWSGMRSVVRRPVR